MGFEGVYITQTCFPDACKPCLRVVTTLLLSKTYSVQVGLKDTLSDYSGYLYHCIHEFSCDSSVTIFYEKVQVGKDQEKAQSEKDSHSKNRGGKKPN